jgi:hypothetical protein
MDQYRATLAAQRREKRVHMTMFTFILDLSITQAYAVYQKMSSEKELPVMSYFILQPFTWSLSTCETTDIFILLRLFFLF